MLRLTNATVTPSGFHAGCRLSHAALSISRSAVPSSALMCTLRSFALAGAAVQAIRPRAASGFQDGSPAPPATAVTYRTGPPVTAMHQTCGTSELILPSKASSVPSGDQDGQ